MEIIKMPLGINDSNCYLLKLRNKEGIIIDPAAEGEKIYKKVKDNGILVKKIVLTHGHFDHIGAADYLRKKLNADICIHSMDADLLTDSKKNLSFICNNPFTVNSADILLSDQDLIMGFKIIHTPGHTPGGICLYHKEEGILFSGDTIFKNSYGRTDFPGADQGTILTSIKKLLILNDNIKVYPGHGPETSIAEYKEFFYYVDKH